MTMQHSMPPFLPENDHLSINKSKAIATALPRDKNLNHKKIVITCIRFIT